MGARTDTRMDLSVPPVVQAQGRGVHGVTRLTDEFRLPELWSLHLYTYEGELEVDGVTYSLFPGTVSLVPPGALIRYRYRGPSHHLYAHLRARGTWRPSALDVTMSPGADLPVIRDLMTSAVAAAATHPERTRCDVWSVLLRLATRPSLRDTDHDPAARHVAVAMSYIEAHLSEPVAVPQVAAAVGVSHSHLTRLFTARTGHGVVGYVRQRRVEHARRLLLDTTMSIAAVAATVGIPDLQAFNKTCRAVTGHSPRQLRQLQVLR